MITLYLKYKYIVYMQVSSARKIPDTTDRYSEQLSADQQWLLTAICTNTRIHDCYNDNCPGETG